MSYTKKPIPYFIIGIFYPKASQSYRIYFVTADSRWNITASSPCIYGNLDSWI